MESLDEIYRKYAKIVYQYLLSLTGNQDLSEELTQEVFYQAVKSIDRYDGSCKITTWLCAIAKNQLAAYRRKHPVTDPLEKEVEEETVSVLDQKESKESAEDEVIRELDHMKLLRQIHLLQEPHREVLYLRIYADLSFRQIGEILGKSENWARVTFYRGKELLRKKISERSD